jgi:hypothetical protein
MRALAIIFAVAALACGLNAAHDWYRSSIVEMRLDSDFEPVVEELHQSGLVFRRDESRERIRSAQQDRSAQDRCSRDPWHCFQHLRKLDWLN